MIEIDGSIGGGSVVRLSVGLSIATGESVKIINIRQSRPNPGLRHQHLAGVNAAGVLSNAKITENKLGSKTLTFSPSSLQKDKINVKIPTAGSIGLVLQTLQLALTKASDTVEIEIHGGATAGKWAPPAYFMKHINFSILEMFGYKASLNIRKHGFYPKGGAFINAEFYPQKMKRIELVKKGSLKQISGISTASDFLKISSVAERQRKETIEILKNLFPSEEVNIKYEYVKSDCPGSVISLFAEFDNTCIGADALGEKGKKAEKVGHESANELIKFIKSDSPVDDYMADQIIPYLGLFKGEVKIRKITDHVRTNVEITNKFVRNKLNIDKNKMIIRSS